MTLNLKLNQKNIAVINLADKSFSVSAADQKLRDQLNAFLKSCVTGGIHTFIEPEEIKPKTITIIETVAWPGQRGFLPALVRRLHYLVPGAEIEITGPDDELERVRNLVRHELASLPSGKTLQPTIRQIMETVDKLSLEQATEVLAMLEEKNRNEKLTS